MQGKVLLLSQRRIADLVGYCLTYELEDTFTAVTDAQRIDVTGLDSLEYSRRVYKFARLTSGSSTIARRLAPAPRCTSVLEHDVELFFPVFNHIYELYSLATIPNWRERSRKAACFISEVGLDQLPAYLLELLSAFDHIFLGTRNRVEHVAKVTSRPCTYLPHAADVLRFAPASLDQPRPIDVCNVGRRSSVTHEALLERAERQKNFYYFDTVAASGANLKDRTFRVDSPREHRRMLSVLLNHSSYYVANRSHVNKPEFAVTADQISARYYEGAAAGTVMFGEVPSSKEFQEQFDWTDAVIPVPFDCPEIGTILDDLNGNPERLQAIRRTNVREAALRHDWLYRIRVVFDTLGLPVTEKMQARARQLDRIASQAIQPPCRSTLPRDAMESSSS